MSKPRAIRARPLSKQEDVLPFLNEELIPFLRQLQGNYVPLIGASIMGGAGVPTVPPPPGITVALWLRNNGGAGTSLYLFRAGAWVAIA